MLVDHPFVPYTEIGPVMRAADLLVALSNRSTQRIPAKFYDYVLAERPMLAIADNQEFGSLVRSAGGERFGMDEPEKVADAVEAQMKLGRQRTVKRAANGLTTEEASVRMAEVLDSVVA